MLAVKSFYYYHTKKYVSSMNTTTKKSPASSSSPSSLPYSRGQVHDSLIYNLSIKSVLQIYRKAQREYCFAHPTTTDQNHK